MPGAVLPETVHLYLVVPVVQVGKLVIHDQAVLMLRNVADGIPADNRSNACEILSAGERGWVVDVVLAAYRDR